MELFRGFVCGFVCGFVGGLFFNLLVDYSVDFSVDRMMIFELVIDCLFNGFCLWLWGEIHVLTYFLRIRWWAILCFLGVDSVVDVVVDSLGYCSVDLLWIC